MIYVPAGTFQMGSVEGDPDTARAELPRHPVTLDAYWIDKYEVTNARIERCVEDGVFEEPTIAVAPAFSGGDQPVVGGSWEDAETYCGGPGHDCRRRRSGSTQRGGQRVTFSLGAMNWTEQR
jgi:formylglycine-generating enzyme required for sulfatase activity